jgi:pseudaminic acid biosynthesis-associated methylase
MGEKRKMKSTPQLEAWEGQFGDRYVERNDYADWKMEPGIQAFERMIGSLDLVSVLEVGSNIGLNLLFINELFKGALKLFAVEPNQKALSKLLLQPQMKIEKAWNCDAFQIPLDDKTIDLVFTAGVLIHIAPKDLARATDEIVRVSRKYILCIEYFSHQPVEVTYRGRTDLLFKRDFGDFYLDRFQDLVCLDYGFLWQRELRIFDNLNWWLFKKLT